MNSKAARPGPDRCATHWFDAPFLAALLATTVEEAGELMAELQRLTNVEPFPARGDGACNVHEASRLALREHLRTKQPALWKTYARRAHAHLASGIETHVRIEALFHLFAADPKALPCDCHSSFFARMRTFIPLATVFVAMTFSACSIAGDESSCLPIGSFRPPHGKDEATVLAKMEDSWRESKGSHRMVVRAFSDNQQALAEFFKASYGSSGSAAGSEMRNDFTLSLLYYWGDHRFATVLSSQPAKVRRGVGSHLWVGTENAAVFSKAFPETAKTAFLSRP